MSRKRLLKGMAGLMALGFFFLATSAFATVSFSPNGGSYTYDVGDTVNTTITVNSTTTATGTNNLVFSSATGSLPSGLSFSPSVGGTLASGTGNLSGTITISGTISSSARNSSVTITATDIDGSGTSSSYNFTINLEITTISLPNGMAGNYYSQALSAQGGGASRSWSLLSGTLPLGLSLSPSGVISGLPTTSSTSNFTVEVTDGSQTDQQSLSIIIESAGIQPIASEGQILYVEDITRDTDTDEPETTGNLYVKNLETGTERKITDFTEGAILNPQFTPDGSEVLFTYSDGTDPFQVYLVSVNITIDSADEGKVAGLSDIEGENLKYAALSPDYDGENGLLVYTQDATDRVDLWVYNFATELKTRIKTEAGLGIKHPVFIDDTTIAYIGTIDGIQDIYTISAGGGLATNLTNNISRTPEYGRLLSSQRNPGLSVPYLIYPKRVWAQWVYGDWDVYVRPVGGSEVDVTNTFDEDELDPAFYGSSSTMPSIGPDGQMFYSAAIATNVDIWQANYDIATTDTNTSVSQRVKDTDDTDPDFGLVNWGPAVEDVDVTDLVSIEETRFVYSLTEDIYRANYNGADAIKLTVEDGTAKDEPNIARNGGTIVYTADFSTTTDWINKMNHDGTDEGPLVAGYGVLNIGQASISPDGRWVVYVKQTVGGTTPEYDIEIADTATGTDTYQLGLDYPLIESPYFNPDMTKIVYSANTSGPSDPQDIYTYSVVVDNTAGVSNKITFGAEINLTDNTNTNDRQPCFSNDGTKIIFISDRWDAKEQIFTMDVTGTGMERVVENTGTDTFAYPVYGPVYDSDNGADGVAYIQNGQIYYAFVYRDSADNPLVSSGNNPSFGNTATGIVPDDDKFGWGIIRTKGTVVARRYLPDKTAVSIPMDYDIIVDVDEASVPNGYTIEEVLSDDFDVNSVVIEGGTVKDHTVVSGPGTNQQTIRILFQSDVADHVIRINLTPAAEGVEVVTGSVIYTLNGTPMEDSITGNGIIEISAPYMPVDIYDENNTLEPNGVIESFDLLYAIDSWATDAQLQGFGPKWPQDITNWNNIILAVINIWSDDDADGKIDESGGSTNTVVGATGAVQSEPGEYVFIGDTDADDTVDLYSPGGVIGDGYPEMYWTEGEWGSL
jgi:Tol biopolymer transport system component